MGLVRTLIDSDQEHMEPALPQGLRELYDGDLHFRTPPAERPFVIANFVATLDGVVSYEIKGQASGATISGSDPADRFIMGLLRAAADAVIVGARTVQTVSPKAFGFLNTRTPLRSICTWNTGSTYCINRNTPSSWSLAAAADWSWREQFSGRQECAQW